MVEITQERQMHYMNVFLKFLRLIIIEQLHVLNGSLHISMLIHMRTSSDFYKDKIQTFSNLVKILFLVKIHFLIKFQFFYIHMRTYAILILIKFI